LYFNESLNYNISLNYNFKNYINVPSHHIPLYLISFTIRLNYKKIKSIFYSFYVFWKCFVDFSKTCDLYKIVYKEFSDMECLLYRFMNDIQGRTHEKNWNLQTNQSCKGWTDTNLIRGFRSPIQRERMAITNF
jgi:hypothetical protein